MTGPDQMLAWRVELVAGGCVDVDADEPEVGEAGELSFTVEGIAGSDDWTVTPVIFAPGVWRLAYAIGARERLRTGESECVKR